MNNNSKIISGVLISVFVIILSLTLISPALTDDLIAYWKLDESTGDAIDAHSTHDGTVVGATQGVTGKINTAYSFDGDGDSVTVPDDDLFTPTNTGFALSCWIWRDSSQANKGIIGKDLAAGREWALIDWTNIIFQFAQVPETFAILDADVPPGEWVHVVVSLDTSNNIKMYANGVKKVDDTFTSYPTGTSSPVTFGYYYSSVYEWAGDIDEVYIRNKELTQEEVSELWNDGDGLAYPFVVDTCTCPGAGENWEIDMSDYCNITDACDLTTGTLSFTGAGYCNCNASVDTTNLGDPGASGVLYIQDSCLITID